MMVLLEGHGKYGRITCPYHGWTYDTEGRVIGAGHMGNRDPEFDKKGYRLPELRTEVWQGWIYVTLNPEAPPSPRLLEDLEPEVARYRRRQPQQPRRLTHRAQRDDAVADAKSMSS